MQSETSDREDVRDELAAMDQCYQAISRLKPDAIVRVVEWLQRKVVPRDQLFDTFRRAVEDELAGRTPRIATKYGGPGLDYARPPAGLKMVK